MGREVERHNWPGYFKEFTERNRWRLSELQIREGEGTPQSERDLSLASITVRMRGEGAPEVEISLASGSPGTFQLTRTIPFVRRVMNYPSVGGRGERLEIYNDLGSSAILIFPSFARGRASDLD
jgi:hypothetical protein